MKGPLLFCIFISMLSTFIVMSARVDICTLQPTINGLCVTSTMGIYYDAETQRCKYMGCSPGKKLFATIEDCEKICNSSRHRRLRMHNQKMNLNNTTTKIE